jgi:hypothetical protein
MDFADRCELLAAKIKQTFAAETYAWVATTTPELHHILVEYQRNIAECHNLKQIRYVLEQGCDEIKSCEKNYCRGLIADIMPIFTMRITEIIKNDMYLVYSESEIDYINGKLEERSRRNINKMVNDVIAMINS